MHSATRRVRSRASRLRIDDWLSETVAWDYPAHGDLATESGFSILMSELKTCFKKVDYDLSGLLHYIDIGDIGLPDIQRPFVWSNTKVRDLFDSMYRGFPVGYFLFWENALGGGSKQIGVGTKQHAVAQRLIVDGQQRLTSLFAVFRGRKVLDEDYRERQIEIAFRPRDGSFEVADAAVDVRVPGAGQGTALEFAWAFFKARAVAWGGLAATK